MSAWICRRVDGAGAVGAIGRLRYRVLVEELGRRPVHADATRGTILDPLDAKATHLGVFRQDGPGRESLVGALRILLSDQVSDAGIRDLYGLPPDEEAGRVALVSRLVTEPGARGGAGSAGLALARFAYRVALEEGASAAMIDCERRLEAFFVWLGFDVVRRFEHPGFGPTSVLRLSLFDETRLAQTGSPFRLELEAHRAATQDRAVNAG